MIKIVKITNAEIRHKIKMILDLYVAYKRKHGKSSMQINEALIVIAKILIPIMDKIESDQGLEYLKHNPKSLNDLCDCFLLMDSVLNLEESKELLKFKFSHS